MVIPVFGRVRGIVTTNRICGLLWSLFSRNKINFRGNAASMTENKGKECCNITENKDKECRNITENNVK
jgi:hypothetical protein